MTTASTPPDVLQAAGAALWARVVVEGVEFEPQELAWIEHACRLTDRLDELQAAVDAEGVTTIGSKGQAIVHPAVVEQRLTRAEIGRLLSRVSWPDEAGNAGRALARQRWAG